jgi:hypothetical protein
MTTVNFQQKELVNYQGIVLCDNDNFPKVYSGAKKANEVAIKLGAKIQKIVSTKERYYVVK